jgi:hypothetical protein
MKFMIKTLDMPDPAPVMIIGRLAVHQSFHFRAWASNIRSGLLRETILRAIQALDITGIRSFLVHAHFRRRPFVLGTQWVHRLSH